MKFKYQFLLYIAAVFLLTACQSKLDLTSEDGISPDQVNGKNIVFSLNGLYRSSTPNRDNFIFNDVRGGNYTWTALSGNNSAFGITITGNGLDDSNSFSANIWSYAYENIYQANNVITSAEKLNLPVVKAEAQFIRAFLYYQLVSTFGGVPLITKNTTDDLPRATAQAIWDLILSDLNESLEHANAISKSGSFRVSAEAVKILKARVLLALNRKEEAAVLAKELINSDGRKLDERYDRIFRNTVNSPEVLFAFKNLHTESNVRMSQLFWPYGTEWAGSYFVQPSIFAVENLYESGDGRKDVNIQVLMNTDGTSNTIVSKYWDVQPIIIARLSEAYLIAAEGLGATSEGLSYLNKLREVRGLSAFTLSALNSDEKFLDAVLLERQRELYSEGFLFFDLVRTDKAINLSNIPTKQHYLMPIPGSQIRLSKGELIQNTY